MSGLGGATGSYVNQRMNGIAHNEVDWGAVAVDGVWGAIGGAVSYGVADVGGPGCTTLSNTLSKPAVEVGKQLVEDATTTAVITGTTWLNGTKMNMLRKRAQRNYKSSEVYYETVSGF